MFDGDGSAPVGIGDGVGSSGNPKPRPQAPKGDIDFGEEYYYGTVGKDGNGDDEDLPDYMSSIGDGVTDPHEDHPNEGGGTGGSRPIGPDWNNSTGPGVIDPVGPSAN